MPWAPTERADLARALTEVGPGAPTLCEGWASEDLAAHVVLRESSPLVAAGTNGGPLAARTTRLTRERAARARTPEGYAALVEEVRHGPPRFSPVGLAGDAANLLELYVHTEDVRRAGQGGADRPARTRADEHERQLWRRLGQAARLMYRRCPVGVVLVEDGGRTVRAHRSPQADPTLEVLVTGTVGELVLYTFGRGTHAMIRVQGPEPAVRLLDGFLPR